MAVLPENMNRIDPSAYEQSLRVIDQYIRYMGERIEFSFSQMTKNITAAGASSVEVYILINAMSNEISAIQSNINGIVGRLNSIESSVNTIESGIGAIQGDIVSIQGDITSISTQIEDLNNRVTALEQSV